jgi:hypothetical protein
MTALRWYCVWNFRYRHDLTCITGRGSAQAPVAERPLRSRLQQGERVMENIRFPRFLFQTDLPNDAEAKELAFRIAREFATPGQVVVVTDEDGNEVCKIPGPSEL